jgi:ABC-type polysaccharide/polyol phosphate transport system ATPase subunit
LKDVSFSVPRGSTYGVIGRNGSGKSTALKLVAGITKPTSGTVRVEGRISALIELPPGDLRPREISSTASCSA